jgi:hypothetical protein
MTIQNIKLAIAAAWVIVVAVVAMIAGVSSPIGLLATGAVAAAPLIGMWLMWTEPTETLSESIQHGRR